MRSVLALLAVSGSGVAGPAKKDKDPDEKWCVGEQKQTKQCKLKDCPNEVCTDCLWGAWRADQMAARSAYLRRANARG